MHRRIDIPDKSHMANLVGRIIFSPRDRSLYGAVPLKCDIIDRIRV